MFSVVCLIKAQQTSDCYAALLLTANSYTRLLSVLCLSLSFALIFHVSPSLDLSLILYLCSFASPILSISFFSLDRSILFSLPLSSEETLISILTFMLVFFKFFYWPSLSMSPNRNKKVYYIKDGSLFTSLTLLSSIPSFPICPIVFLCQSPTQLPCRQPKFNYCRLCDNPSPLIGHCCPPLNEHSREDTRRQREAEGVNAQK